jgi:hypothetical protein
MYFKETEYEGVRWIHMSRGGEKWRALVNTEEPFDRPIKSVNGCKEFVLCIYGLTFNNCS